MAAQKKYSIVFVLIRPTGLVSTDKMQNNCSFRRRLVALITQRKNSIFWPPFVHLVYGSKVAAFNVIGSRQTGSVMENEAADDAIKIIPLILITTEATGHRDQ